MRNFSATIQYDGTKYSGWQRQGNTENTIEHRISSVLTAMVGARDFVEVHGSGRTDVGVHALGQVANFYLDTDRTPEDICVYMNKYLPEDIKVLDVKEVSLRFHARLNAKKKTYLYRIDNNMKADVFLRKYTYWNNSDIDIESMRMLIPIFLGQHDFCSFSDVKNGKKSTVRTIHKINIYKADGIIYIEYTGNGFLYHMVRKLTWAFLSVGIGECSVGDIKNTLDMKDRQAFKGIAPAKGLTLVKVEY